MFCLKREQNHTTKKKKSWAKKKWGGRKRRSFGCFTMASSVPRKSQHLYSVLVPTYNERLNIALTCYLLVNALKYATSLSTFLSLSLSLFLISVLLACSLSFCLLEGKKRRGFCKFPLILGQRICPPTLGHAKTMSSNSWSMSRSMAVEHLGGHSL